MERVRLEALLVVEDAEQRFVMERRLRGLHIGRRPRVLCFDAEQRV